MDTAGLRLHQMRFAKHSLVIFRAVQRVSVFGPEDLRVYFRLQVVLDADLAALLHPDPFERATLLERVFAQFHQCAGEHYLFETAVLESALINKRIPHIMPFHLIRFVVFPQSLEALVQHHALQVSAEAERSSEDLFQVRRGLERFQSGESEAVGPDLP